MQKVSGVYSPGRKARRVHRRVAEGPAAACSKVAKLCRSAPDSAPRRLEAMKGLAPAWGLRQAQSFWRTGIRRAGELAPRIEVPWARAPEEIPATPRKVGARVPGSQTRLLSR